MSLRQVPRRASPFKVTGARAEALCARDHVALLSCFFRGKESSQCAVRQQITREHFRGDRQLRWRQVVLVRAPGTARHSTCLFACLSCRRTPPLASDPFTPSTLLSHHFPPPSRRASRVVAQSPTLTLKIVFHRLCYHHHHHHHFHHSHFYHHIISRRLLQLHLPFLLQLFQHHHHHHPHRCHHHHHHQYYFFHHHYHQYHTPFLTYNPFYLHHITYTPTTLRSPRSQHPRNTTCYPHHHHHHASISVLLSSLPPPSHFVFASTIVTTIMPLFVTTTTTTTTATAAAMISLRIHTQGTVGLGRVHTKTRPPSPEHLPIVVVMVEQKNMAFQKVQILSSVSGEIPTDQE
ncbi:hypothetical protein E2C01_023876 [Portunus trituberculatus]|uniref:Uncharacterized protein n=1 Tax=Portunus trituberculatus TaxID=210409 RepID=A0A5B7EB85_PORTR|nr:hypothetical protein [Portunus trituberculatus]